MPQPLRSLLCNRTRLIARSAVALAIISLGSCAAPPDATRNLEPMSGPDYPGAIITDSDGRVIVVQSSWSPSLRSWMLVQSETGAPLWRPVGQVDASDEPWTPMLLKNPRGQVANWAATVVVNEQGQVMLLSSGAGSYVLSRQPDGAVVWRRLDGQERLAHADDSPALAPGGFGVFSVFDAPWPR